MPNIYQIYISIYDTTLPQSAERPENYAEKGTVRLFYEGQDDKFMPIMASRLEFSLEVSHEDSLNVLYYDALFTGNENRYKVTVHDQDDNELWQGFLLPDDYSEPYTTGTFYVNFTAVDNLGILKGKTLPDSFYRARQSVIKIIADCLQLTGLELPIYHAPSIYNVLAGYRYDKIFLHGATWKNDNGENTDAYTVLEEVLEAIGCTLWQQKGVWYVVGHNLRGSGNFIKYEYDYTGAYQSNGYLVIEKQLRLDWNATPQITLKPPFKEVNVVSGVEQTQAVFPSDIVVQKWVKKSAGQAAPPAKYWTGTGLDPEILNNTINDWPEYVDQDVTITGYVGYRNTIGNPNLTQQLANYISLAAPPYVKGGNGETMDFSIEIKVPTIVGDIDDINNGFLMYDVLLNGTTIISNRSNFSDYEKYFLEIDKIETSLLVCECTGTFEIEDFPIPENGFLDVRVYHIGDLDGASTTNAPVVVTRLNIKFNETEEDNEFKKIRSIDRTNVRKLDLAVGDSVIDNVHNAFVYQTEIPSEYLQIIPYVLYENLTVAGNFYQRIYGFNASNYAILQANIDDLYVKKANSDYYQYLQDINDLGTVGGYNLVAINLLGEDQIKVGDRIYHRTSVSGNPETAYRHNQREVWQKTTNSTGEQRFGYTLAEIMHDIYPDATVAIEGRTKGIVFPASYITMNFKGTTPRWVPTRIEIEFNENESQVTLIEHKNDLVEDYQ